MNKKEREKLEKAGYIVFDDSPETFIGDSFLFLDEKARQDIEEQIKKEKQFSSFKKRLNFNKN